MEQQDVEEVRAHISERYPMYVADPGFEQWLLHKAGTDVGKIEDYLTLLDDYGYITGDGTLANDYQNVPDPGHLTEDIERRLASLSPGTRALLRRAAVQGPLFSMSLVTPADRGAAADGDALLGEAIAAGVVARDKDGDARIPALSHRYRFVPRQAAKILYDELSEEERGGYHMALVELLSDEIGRVAEPGAQDMLAEMIRQHNRYAAQPDSFSND